MPRRVPAVALLWAALVTWASSGTAEPVARFNDVQPAPKPPAPPRAVPPTAAPPREPSPREAAPRPFIPTEAPPTVASAVSRPAMKSGAEELADRGKRLEEAQRFTEAITAYSESIKLDPSRGEALIALAKLRLRLGEMSEAELLLSTAARYSSVAAEALTLRAHLRRAEGRAAEAARDLENAANISPDDAARIRELSSLYAARGAWPPALSLWRRAAAVSREDERDRETKVQVRALTLLAAELDPVVAGGGPGYSWTRHAIAKIATR